MDDIQIIQNDFSKIVGVSLWVCNSSYDSITKKTLTGEFDSEEGHRIADIAETTVAKKSVSEDVSLLHIEDKEIIVKSMPVFYEEDILGYCVGIMFKDNTTEVDEEIFYNKVKFFTSIISGIYRAFKEKEKLNEELSRIKVAERNFQVENARLQHENDYDELTKVHSRSYFFKLLEEADKDESLLPISLVVGDVNNLKFTNDMFGHRHGDWLLCVVADILQQEAEAENYTVARCGGDEFFVYMPNTRRSGANYYCKRVKERLAQEFSTCLTPSISLGCAKKSEMTQSLNRLLEVADAKMYAVKSEFKQEQNSFEEILNVLKARGYTTEELLSRTCDIAEQFATALDWKQDRIQKCIYLARYQDIGLSIVPKRVYRKEGEYNEREWREIKKHPQLGMKIALISTETEGISDWMYYTHENYDGTGWPRALSGKAIPPEVTLVRLATEFAQKEDAEGQKAAYDFIVEQSGRMFEPSMADEFVRFLDENIVK